MTNGFTSASGWRGPAAEPEPDSSELNGCAAAMVVAFCVLLFTCGLLLGMVIG